MGDREERGERGGGERRGVGKKGEGREGIKRENRERKMICVQKLTNNKSNFSTHPLHNSFDINSISSVPEV